MLDLSKFEKISEDKDKTRMRHKDGHEMVILMSALPKIHREQLKRLKMAKGGMAHYDEGAAPVSQDDQESDQAAPSNLPEQPKEVVAPPNPELDALTAQKAEALPIDQNLGNPTNAALTAAQGVQLGQKAANLQQQIDSAKAKGMIPIEQQGIANDVAAAHRYDQAYADVSAATKSLDDYAKGAGRIDPRAIYENMSTPGKISSALGVLLGGFTGGFSGSGNNPALNYLKDQQEKDIAAQQSRWEQQKTVWGAYQKKYENANVSTALAAKSWNDMLSRQANILTQRIGTPQAQQANMALQSKLLLDSNDKLQKAAFFANQPRAGGLNSSSQNSKQNISLNHETVNGQKQVFGPESASDDGSYNIQPILKPGAAGLIDQYARRASLDPAAAAQLPALQKQYADAAKADEVLKQAKEIFSKLKFNATPGGWLGRSVGASPFGAAGAAAGATQGGGMGAGLGASIGEAVGQYAGDLSTAARKGVGSLLGRDMSDEQSQNRDYNAYAQKLSDLFSSVYKGIGVENLKNKLSGMLPDKNDSKENVITKEKAFEDLIKSGLERNVLQNAGMAN